MKIIDKNGRLFGKINIIDFFLLVLLISTIPAFYYGHKVMTAKSMHAPLPLPAVEYMVQFICPNCHNSIKINIPFGQSVKNWIKKQSWAECPICKCEIKLGKQQR